MKIIPLFDLSRQNKSIKNKVIRNWIQVFNENSFTSGKETQLFEKNFAKLCNSKYAVGVHSGTDSLILTLLAFGIGPGDEVITTPCSFTATTDAIVHVGATPVFSDVISSNGNIDPKEIAKKITNNTKAILLVHLYGVPCEMDEILQLAKSSNILVIEDASHAHGSTYKNKPVGSIGDAGCFSLYPSKSLGSFGNAGIITSNNEQFITKVKMLANHGIQDSQSKYTHHISGFNKLIDNIQSAGLIHKLPLLKKIIEKKLTLAKIYNSALRSVGLEPMHWPTYTSPSLYVFAFQTAYRDILQNHFKKQGITTGIYYPTPIHLQPSMKKLGHTKGDFPVAEKFFDQTISIPIFDQLSSAEVKKIVRTIKTISL